MRLVVFFIGLVAVASVGAAQSLPTGPSRLPLGSSKPIGPRIKPPSIKPIGPSIRLPDPRLIPPVPGRKCPPWTEGKWPDCKTIGEKKCPEQHHGQMAQMQTEIDGELRRQRPYRQVAQLPHARPQALSQRH